jgi:hypothetical protein
LGPADIASRRLSLGLLRHGSSDIQGSDVAVCRSAIPFDYAAHEVEILAPQRRGLALLGWNVEWNDLESSIKTVA